MKKIFFILLFPLLGQFFNPVNPTGNPYTVIITSVYNDQQFVEHPVEIGIFDNDLCVGSGLTHINSSTPITVWMGDQSLDLEGFTSGNNITFKLYSSLFDLEHSIDSSPVFEQGNGDFGYGSYSSVILSYIHDEFYSLGDVNKNGFINVIDVLIMVSTIININQLEDNILFLSDINGDTILNIDDIFLVLNQILSINS